VKKCWRYVIRFDTIHERDGHTHTDTLDARIARQKVVAVTVPKVSIIVVLVKALNLHLKRYWHCIRTDWKMLWESAARSHLTPPPPGSATDSSYCVTSWRKWRVADEVEDNEILFRGNVVWFRYLRCGSWRIHVHPDQMTRHLVSWAGIKLAKSRVLIYTTILVARLLSIWAT